MRMEHGQIVLIPLKGMRPAAERIKEYFGSIDCEASCEIVEVKLMRFATGDAKADLQSSVRGKDVFIIVDVGRHDVEYEIFDKTTFMSPDDHYQDLIRTISAVGGKAARVNVISPLLYGARQDRRIGRESLDCAVALQHLESIGVSNIMAFDVHDDRVSNAVPFMGFDKLMPTYQTIKALSRSFPDLIFDEKHMIMVSPDLGGAARNLTYANEMGIDMGVFYKRRSMTQFVDGKHPVEYIDISDRISRVRTLSSWMILSLRVKPFWIRQKRSRNLALRGFLWRQPLGFLRRGFATLTRHMKRVRSMQSFYVMPHIVVMKSSKHRGTER